MKFQKPLRTESIFMLTIIKFQIPNSKIGSLEFGI